jgi:cytochrome c-type biogenesis protein CcmH
LSDRTRTLAVLVAAVAVVGLAVVFASGGSERSESVDDRVHEIGAGLRCPVCLNLSVADSPSPLAGEMRAQIETQLRSGRSPEQVRAFFVDRYGEWILLAPTRRGLNLLPWAIPIVGLLVGAAVWFGLVRRRTPRDDAAASTSERARIERDLANLQEPG